MSDYPSFTYLGQQLLELMTERGVRANAMCYTSLIKICTASNDLNSALAVWELMKQRQVRPDVHVFTSLLAACAIKKGNEEKAEALLKEMEQFGVEPNLHLYSALIDVYAKTTNISRAFATLEAMVPNLYFHFSFFIFMFQ
jgi:pentatricopeptide repeat protein